MHNLLALHTYCKMISSLSSTVQYLTFKLSIWIGTLYFCTRVFMVPKLSMCSCVLLNWLSLCNIITPYPWTLPPKSYERNYEHMYSLQFYMQNSMESPDLDCSRSAWVKWTGSTSVLAHLLYNEHHMKVEPASACQNIKSELTLLIDTLFQSVCCISSTCALY